MKREELRNLMSEKSERGELARTILHQYILVKNSEYDKLSIPDKAKMRHVYYVAGFMKDASGVKVAYKPAGYFAKMYDTYTDDVETFISEFTPYVCDIT